MKIEAAGAVVSGGASGLGEATVRRLHAGGAQVVIADVNPEKGEALASELGIEFVQCDVRDEDQVQAAVDKAAEADGGLRIAVSCAGTGIPIKVASSKGPHPLEAFKVLVDINLVGTFNLMRLAAFKMLSENQPNDEGERGVLINTASVAAFDGQVGQIAYSATKGGVVGMTLPAARDLADKGIRVCTIAPGLFDTPLLGCAARGRAHLARQAGAVPEPARAPGGVRASSRRTSSRTRCSTARRSASTARSGWRRASSTERRTGGRWRAPSWDSPPGLPRPPVVAGTHSFPRACARRLFPPGSLHLGPPAVDRRSIAGHQELPGLSEAEPRQLELLGVAVLGIDEPSGHVTQHRRRPRERVRCFLQQARSLLGLDGLELDEPAFRECPRTRVQPAGLGGEPPGHECSASGAR